MEERRLKIILLEEADQFLQSLPEKVQKKIAYNINRVSGGEMSKELFEKLNDNIWELRTIYNETKYRLLAFWDPYRRSLVVATNGFVKKNQKTPSKELTRAELIRKQYLNSTK